MNCYRHLNWAAVAACPKCGMGLCKHCVDNAAYTYDNRPLCHNCSLGVVEELLGKAKREKTWSLVKFVFGASFLLLGYSIYSSTGDLMNGWIYAGIAGIPAAFRSTRPSRRDQLRNDVQDALTTDMMEMTSNWLIRLLVRIAAILFFAPITATIAAIKNLYVFLTSFGRVKRLQAEYDILVAEDNPMQEEAAQAFAPAFPDTPAAPAQAVLPNQTPETAGLAQPAPETPAAPAISAPVAPAQVLPPAAPAASAAPVTPPPAPASRAYATSAPQAPAGSVAAAPNKKNMAVAAAIVVGVVLVAGGLIGYFSWYVPYAKDRDALRTYVVATNVFLRSSQVAGVEYNVVEKVPYGSELITYTMGNEWAEVKLDGKTGYVASAYLLTSADFNLLHGVWGTMDSKECIISSKCRLAILDYYKNHSLQSGTNGWQIYTKQKDQKPNSIFYPRLYNKSSKFTDFVFLVKNNATGERRLACYSFEDETEKPIFRFDTPAPAEGYIRNVQNGYSGARILFDTGEQVNVEF